uniref:PLD phosphodiesterase domain-containing protein n=1 Tax=Eucampia antarctica TaxID=49252 RepID=A0A7S2S8X3_9STRA
MGDKWLNGKTLAMHAKHYIVDDKCCYIGSQNLYDCDLGEWGVLIDDKDKTRDIMNEYWIPMWESSFIGKDVNTEAVLNAMKIEKSTEKTTVQIKKLRKSCPQINMVRQSLIGGTVNIDLGKLKSKLYEISDDDDSDQDW